MSNNTEEIIRKVVSRNCDSNDESNQIGLDENLQDLGVNSSSYIRIVTDIEKEFDIEFDDENLDYKRFATLKDIINFVEENIPKV